MKISSGSRKEVAASPVQQELLELERRIMDYFMIILPLKLALIVYIGYVLFH